MKNFLIKAKGEGVAEIDIFGHIGESWFSEEEGNTMQSIKAKLQEIDADVIIVNISSLGGDAFQGLTIHDILKSHSAKTIAKIIGATASAGTIIALGCDEIQMSENALFLIHNCWGVAVGNAEEVRNVAADMDQVDNRMISIYKKKSGKRENTVRELMKEEKWIDAEEALDFGFIDKVFTPSKAAASAFADAFGKINASGKLPKIPENLIKKINNDMEIKKDSLFNRIMSAVKKELNISGDTITMDEKVKTAIDSEAERLETEFTAAQVEASKKVKSDLEAIHNTALAAKDTVITGKDTEISTLKTQLTEAQAEVARLKGTETSVDKKDPDPASTSAKKKLSRNALAAEKNAAILRGEGADYEEDEDADEGETE